MERVISAELINYLWQHRLITKDQHGFSQKSTSTNLLESLNDWTLNITSLYSKYSVQQEKKTKKKNVS